MQAADIMTPGVITATQDTPIVELIRLMLSHHISAVPIVDHETLVGIVSEDDLLRRPELGSEPRSSRWLELLSSKAYLADQYAHTHGVKAGEVMTLDVITVADSTPVAEVAAVLLRRGIKRVPVMRDGKLIGIISRANLMRALACRIAPDVTVDDRRIRDTVLAGLRGQRWGGAPEDGSVLVQDGVVHLWGYFRSDAERKARIVLAETTAGVRAVKDHMEHWTTPDPFDRPNWPAPVAP